MKLVQSTMSRLAALITILIAVCSSAMSADTPKATDAESLAVEAYIQLAPSSSGSVHSGPAHVLAEGQSAFDSRGYLENSACQAGAMRQDL